MTVENILVIYEEVPENTHIALIPNKSGEYERLSKIAGTFVNSDDLTAEQEQIHDELSNALSSGWFDYILDSKKPMTIPPNTVVIMCGFIL